MVRSTPDSADRPKRRQRGLRFFCTNEEAVTLLETVLEAGLSVYGVDQKDGILANSSDIAQMSELARGNHLVRALIGRQTEAQLADAMRGPARYGLVVFTFPSESDVSFPPDHGPLLVMANLGAVNSWHVPEGVCFDSEALDVHREVKQLFKQFLPYRAVLQFVDSGEERPAREVHLSEGARAASMSGVVLVQMGLRDQRFFPA